MRPIDLANAYQRGENITLIMRGLEGADGNTEESIELAYDLQAGSYIEALEDPQNLDYGKRYGKLVAEEIQALTEPKSVLEAGIGEGTTLFFVLKSFDRAPENVHGLDISWSRIARCQQWLKDNQVAPFLSVASLLSTPYADSSFDVVYTSHAVEPNGGKEVEVLTELYRVTSRYLVLFEPAYELASPEGRARMQRLGYCRNLPAVAKELGMQVERHDLLPICANPLNPTAITVIAKDPSAKSITPQLACPRYLSPLADYGDSLFAAESLRAYPKVGGIPCLRPGDGIVASHFERFSSR